MCESALGLAFLDFADMVEGSYSRRMSGAGRATTDWIGPKGPPGTKVTDLMTVQLFAVHYPLTVCRVTPLHSLRGYTNTGHISLQGILLERNFAASNIVQKSWSSRLVFILKMDHLHVGDGNYYI